MSPFRTLSHLSLHGKHLFKLSKRDNVVKREHFFIFQTLHKYYSMENLFLNEVDVIRVVKPAYFDIF